MASWVSCPDHFRIRPSSYILAVSFTLACSALWARAQKQPNSSQTPPAQAVAEPIPEASAPTASLEVTSAKPWSLLLAEATPVKLKLLHSLNSKTVVEDDPLNFAVAADVIVNGKIVAKVGAVAIGRVRQAKPARVLGRGGQSGARNAISEGRAGSGSPPRLAGADWRQQERGNRRPDGPIRTEWIDQARVRNRGERGLNLHRLRGPGHGVAAAAGTVEVQ